MADEHTIIEPLPEWLTGEDVKADRAGLAAYTHLIRSADDPERQPREARRGKETAWRRDFKISTRAAWRDRIIAHLADGVPRTLNRIAVELADANASTVFGKAPDLALWDLVYAGKVEHSTNAPILFRIVGAASYVRDPHTHNNGGHHGGRA